MNQCEVSCDRGVCGAVKASLSVMKASLSRLCFIWASLCFFFGVKSGQFGVMAVRVISGVCLADTARRTEAWIQARQCLKTLQMSLPPLNSLLFRTHTLSPCDSHLNA